ncbi:MAG: nucleotide sugar dehydrogenase, partial [Victivallaceae bacterium]|nr:nucleotide sugar dehydrogenase [Victivallaceae bacterium]
LPFVEAGADQLLAQTLGHTLFASADQEVVRTADTVVFVTGTPVDEHHNPRLREVFQVIDEYLPQLNASQLIVLRSTLFPGTSEVLAHKLTEKLGSVKLAFCPERILQGHGIEEIFALPQIVSGANETAEQEAAELFSMVTPKIIRLSLREAELAKLFTNSWRYLEFAIANQFYMIAQSHSCDFHRIFEAMTCDYPRAKYFARPGFAAGPCLFKDTMQLSSFQNNAFFLGQSAMLVNEGLPNFVIGELADKMPDHSLVGKKIALLGMTFKADNDDVRESLSFKLAKLLEFREAIVLRHDPYVAAERPLEEILSEADAVILGTPHREYRNLILEKPFVDCWGLWHQPAQGKNS